MVRLFDFISTCFGIYLLNVLIKVTCSCIDVVTCEVSIDTERISRINHG